MGIRSRPGGSSKYQLPNVVPRTAQSEYYLRSEVQEALAALGDGGHEAGRVMKSIRPVRYDVYSVNLE
jgi:hypothetical protein